MQLSKAALYGILGVFLALGTDQLHKYWMLHVYDISARAPVNITSFMDWVMVWNKGVSYGLFTQNSALGTWVLTAFTALVVSYLCFWLYKARGFCVAVGLGLIIGGALGNIVDRLIYGAVADFFSLHWRGFYWYVFNVADIWIVAGVGILLYDSLVCNTKQRHNAASVDE